MYTLEQAVRDGRYVTLIMPVSILRLGSEIEKKLKNRFVKLVGELAQRSPETLSRGIGIWTPDPDFHGLNYRATPDEIATITTALTGHGLELGMKFDDELKAAIEKRNPVPLLALRSSEVRAAIEERIGILEQQASADVHAGVVRLGRYDNRHKAELLFRLLQGAPASLDDILSALLVE